MTTTMMRTMTMTFRCTTSTMTKAQSTRSVPLAEDQVAHAIVERAHSTRSEPLAEDQVAHSCENAHLAVRPERHTEAEALPVHGFQPSCRWPTDRAKNRDAQQAAIDALASQLSTGEPTSFERPRGRINVRHREPRNKHESLPLLPLWETPTNRSGGHTAVCLL